MIICGDSKEELKNIESESVDLLCTDPPYGYSFMGKSWDKTLPDIGIFKECFRVLKPGAFAFVMSAPRSDVCARMMLLLEDAGFEIGFTSIYWTYASGFPKAMNIGKVVDKRNGRSQDNPEFRQYLRSAIHRAGKTLKECNYELGTQMMGHYTGDSQPALPTVAHWKKLRKFLHTLDNRFDELIEREEAEREVLSRKPMTIGIGGASGRMGSEKVIDLPKTDAAKALDGSYGGFQPKPAVEVIVVAMKPLSEKTYVDQALKNGKGVTWLDDCKIPVGEDGSLAAKNPHTKRENSREYTEIYGEYQSSEYEVPTGRFPANLLVSDDVLNDGRILKGNFATSGESKDGQIFGYGNDRGDAPRGFGDSGSYSRYFDLDAWAKTLPFLIVPKASKREKNEGLGHMEAKAHSSEHFSTPRLNDQRMKRRQLRLPNQNNHPTVKPLKLMSYLITLGSRPGDVVLDPFLGSGTTALAAKELGRQYIGIEREKEYVEIAEARLKSAQSSLL